MEQPNNNEHIVDIPTTSSNGSNNSNSSSTRRGRWGLWSYFLWVSVEVVLAVSQIIASIIVLVVSRHEHPRAPLFTWIVGYASGYVACLPLLYWHYQVSEQESAHSRRGNERVALLGVSITVSPLMNPEVEERQASPRSGQTSVASIASLDTKRKLLIKFLGLRHRQLHEYFRVPLMYLFVIWFVVGNVWTTFRGHSSASDAPMMYRWCVVFLTFSFIKYAMFTLWSTIQCYRRAYIISHLGVREDPKQTRGATAELINALPTYKFKLDKKQNGEVAGIVAAGTEQERSISGEDAVCCICLGKYANNDELRELRCLHFFHKECVGKWLQINASCPLCNKEIGGRGLGSNSGASGGH